MNITTLPKVKETSKRRVGRGHGGGRVKTAGRGTKGQKARGSISPFFEGGIVSIIKRLPVRRGRGRNIALAHKPVVLNVKVLNLLPSGSIVDIELLIKRKIVNKDAQEVGIKVLGEGTLSIPLQVKLPTSKGARKKIEKAGGKIIEL